MAKFLIYCYDCDEEYETNQKKGKCPYCGSHNTEMFGDHRRSSKEWKKDFDRTLRKDF